jgi:hypothetical protein
MVSWRLRRSLVRFHFSFPSVCPAARSLVATNTVATAVTTRLRRPCKAEQVGDASLSAIYPERAHDAPGLATRREYDTHRRRSPRAHHHTARGRNPALLLHSALGEAMNGRLHEANDLPDILAAAAISWPPSCVGRDELPSNPWARGSHTGFFQPRFPPPPTKRQLNAPGRPSSANPKATGAPIHPHAKPHVTNNLRHCPPHLLPSTMYHGTHQ